MYGPSSQDIYYANKSPYTKVSHGAKKSSVDSKYSIPFFQSPQTRVEVQAQSTNMTAWQIFCKSFTRQGRSNLAVEQRNLYSDISACRSYNGASAEINNQVGRQQSRFEEQVSRINHRMHWSGNNNNTTRLPENPQPTTERRVMTFYSTGEFPKKERRCCGDCTIL